MSEGPKSSPGATRSLLVRLYAINRFRGPVRWLIRRLEGPDLTSQTLREIFRRHYDVEIGMYTHGACFEPFTLDERTTIGRYCSVAKGARVLNHNHPVGFKSTSGIFFNPHFGLTDRCLIEFNPLVIGNDVWIGANAVIMPEVNTIGDGAIIGAGAVVNRDVPPYAVVLGNPGRTVKFRFAQDTIDQLLEEQWWNKDLDELVGVRRQFQGPLLADDAGRFEQAPTGALNSESSASARQHVH